MNTEGNVCSGTDHAANRVSCPLQYFSVRTTLYSHAGECYNYGAVVCDAVYLDKYGRSGSSLFRVGSLLFCPKHSPVSRVRQGLRVYRTDFNF